MGEWRKKQRLSVFQLRQGFLDHDCKASGINATAKPLHEHNVSMLLLLFAIFFDYFPTTKTWRDFQVAAEF